MDIQKAQELLEKHGKGTLTKDEQALLDRWYLEVESQQPPAEPSADLMQKQKQVFARIDHTLHPKTRSLWPRIAAAASIVVIFSAGYFLIRRPAIQNSEQVAYHNDIAPGHNQATLTLANGQKIILTKGLSGQIATQGQVKISASEQDIVYTANASADAVGYNTLSTAKGEQSPYPLVLEDGTKVWLNAESSLTFPTAFNAKERIVKLTGEAYFEVKHNASQPFKVQTEKQTIQDIGTSFNVNAYPNEPQTKTTLIEGVVKVNNITLKPGEQTEGTKAKQVNVAQFIAWKNHDFYFDNDHIETVMRQLSRWYNIEVNYEGPVTTEVFYAQLSREKNISAILRGLEKTKGVHFKIEGRRVTVSK